MAKLDLPNSNSGGANNLTSELAQYNYLYSLYPRSTTSDITFTSSSSNIIYSTATYSSGKYQNQGQNGMLSILTEVLANYLVTAIDFNNKTETSDFNAHVISGSKHNKTARFVIGTSTAGWASTQCDYLCDGTADDVEINAAITALPATGGEIIILDGTYNITSRIIASKSFMKLRGSGDGTILKRMYDEISDNGLITVTGNYCIVENLSINGNKVTYTSIYNYGIYLYGSYCKVFGNTCSNSNNGICSNQASNNTILGNNCNSNNYGIRLMASNNNTITGNSCNSNATAGLYASGVCSNNTITGNSCNSNSLYGIYLNTTGSNNTITGNSCNSNGDTGINLSATSGNSVIGNSCNSNPTYGIYLYNGSTFNTVSGNTTNNNGIGICLYTSCNNNTITGNSCMRGTGLAGDYSASQYTIQINGTTSSYNLISSNNIMGKDVTNGGGTLNTLVNNKFN